LVIAKLALIAIFLIITGPTATHAIANAARVSGLTVDRDLNQSKADEKHSKTKKQ